VFDIVYLITDRPGFAVAAAYMMGAGIIGGLLAAPFGWIDWFNIPADTRAKRVGLVRGLGDIVVVVLFAVSWLLRAGAAWEPDGVGAGVQLCRGGAGRRDGVDGRRTGGAPRCRGRRGCRRRCAELVEPQTRRGLTAQAVDRRR
jgi:hypothetical protein